MVRGNAFGALINTPWYPSLILRGPLDIFIGENLGVVSEGMGHKTFVSDTGRGHTCLPSFRPHIG